MTFYFISLLIFANSTQMPLGHQINIYLFVFLIKCAALNFTIHSKWIFQMSRIRIKSYYLFWFASLIQTSHHTTWIIFSNSTKSQQIYLRLVIVLEHKWRCLIHCVHWIVMVNAASSSLHIYTLRLYCRMYISADCRIAMWHGNFEMLLIAIKESESLIWLRVTRLV